MRFGRDFNYKLTTGEILLMNNVKYKILLRFQNLAKDSFNILHKRGAAESFDIRRWKFIILDTCFCGMHRYFLRRDIATKFFTSHRKGHLKLCNNLFYYIAFQNSLF